MFSECLLWGEHLWDIPKRHLQFQFSSLSALRNAQQGVSFLTKILCMHHSFYPQKRKQTFSYSHSVTRISILNNVSVGFIIKDRRHQKTCVILVCIFNLNGSFWKKKLDNDILPGFIIESPPKPHRPISITDRHNCERNKSNSVGIKRYPHYKTYLPSLLF